MAAICHSPDMRRSTTPPAENSRTMRRQVNRNKAVRHAEGLPGSVRRSRTSGDRPSPLAHPDRLSKAPDLLISQGQPSTLGDLLTARKYEPSAAQPVQRGFRDKKVTKGNTKVVCTSCLGNGILLVSGDAVLPGNPGLWGSLEVGQTDHSIGAGLWTRTLAFIRRPLHR